MVRPAVKEPNRSRERRILMVAMLVRQRLLTHRASPLARAGAAVGGRVGRHPDRAALLIIIAAALAIRLAFAFRAPVFLVHDSVTYFQAGYDFARGTGFDLAFKRTPLYPLFVSGVVALVSEDLQALGFVQHLLGVLTAVLSYLLGRALFGRPAGFVAGLIAALSGPRPIARRSPSSRTWRATPAWRRELFPTPLGP